LDFILSNLPILLCALAGMALIVLEIFIPGFGFPGITGIALLLVSIGFTANNHGAVAALGMTVVIVAILAIAAMLALRSTARGALSKSRLVLNDAITDDEGASQVANLQAYIGRSGITCTVLRPVGIAEFDGTRLEVATEGDFIDKDQPVVVTRVEGKRIIIRKA